MNLCSSLTGHQPQGDRLSGSLVLYLVMKTVVLEKGLPIRDSCTCKSRYIICVIILHVYLLMDT